MYGLILENFSAYLKHKYGDDTWEQVRLLANVDSPMFFIHQVSTKSSDRALSMSEVKKKVER